MTAEEREEIIQEAVERTLLSLPKVVGNLMQTQAAYAKMNIQFYKDHPEFANHRDVVAKVLEQVDGANPGEEYETKLKQAVPEIKRRLKMMDSLDMTDVVPKAKINRMLEMKGNGEL